MINNSKYTELKSIFGTMYCMQNNPTTISDNYHSIISTRKSLQSKIYFFLNNTSQNSLFELSKTDLDLLEFSTFPSNISQYQELPKYLNYYNYDELHLFKVLKKLTNKEESLNSEDVQILQHFLIVNTRIKSLISSTKDNVIEVDKFTLSLLFNLSNNKILTTGHTISIYEKICQELKLGIYTINPTLEYRTSLQG